MLNTQHINSAQSNTNTQYPDKSDIRLKYHYKVPITKSNALVLALGVHRRRRRTWQQIRTKHNRTPSSSANNGTTINIVIPSSITTAIGTPGKKYDILISRIGLHVRDRV